MKFFLLILEWLFLLFALVIFSASPEGTVTESYQEMVITGVALLLGSFIFRTVRMKRVFPRTGLEIPWLIGVTSAAIAAWIAYDRPMAFLQFSRLLAAFAIYYAIVDLPSVFIPWLAGAFLLIAAGLAVYFPMQYNYNAAPIKIVVINRAGSWINTWVNDLLTSNSSLSHLQSLLVENSIHPNVAAGTLAVAVPFGIALAGKNLHKRDRLPQLLSGILALLLTLIILSGLVLTSSRGALMALIGTAVLALFTLVQRRWFNSHPGRTYFWVGILASGLLIIGLGVFSGMINDLLGGIPDPSGTIQSRAQLWRQGIDLIGDYIFTGSGLMTFWMVHGGYNLQLFIPFIAHVHNTFLETWIEQGILGMVALLSAIFVIVYWFWKALPRQQVMVLGWAGIAALCVAILHGMVDVVFSVSRTLPVVGLITGYAWFVNSQDLRQTSEVDEPARLPDWMLYSGGVAIAIVVGVLLLSWRPLMSLWYANQGALAQTRLELTQYDPASFETLSIDDIRRNATPAQLAPIYSAFASALSLNPENRTALQRMAQIAYSRGEYPQSLDYTQQLWSLGYRDDTTRLLHGDALIANGDLPNAAQVLHDLTWAEDRLMAIAWYRYWTAGEAHRAADIWRVVLMLNPGNSDADHWLKEAQSLIQDNSSP